MNLKSWRLIYTGYGTAEHNLAIDEALLNNFKEGDLPIFRLYRWKPSLSLGRFSNVRETLDLERLDNRNISYVRRMTGGGVLVHGGDLSYSLILPRESLKDVGVKKSYRYLCKFLIEFYKRLGLSASFAYDLKLDISKSDICMVANEPYDIVIDGKKIGGNAQRYTSKTLFQHGSIPVSLDEIFLKEVFLKDLEDVSTLNKIGIKATDKQLSQLLVESFSQTFKVNMVADTLSIEEQRGADELLENKYTLKTWNQSAKHVTSKPQWLHKKIRPSINAELESIFADTHVNTVCQEAMCPNISECFSQKLATFLILGTLCTRTCSFCAVAKGKPMALDINEPENVAQTVKRLGLQHVVITSPTRDDLIDGGAEHFCRTVSAIKAVDNSIVVELLIPDMRENKDSLKLIAKSGAEIIGHNLETVPRLYHVRKGSEYRRSLRVLKLLASLNPDIAIKSGIMLGFGERDEEVETLMHELLDAGCNYLSIGQFLSPSNNHTPVVEYSLPERFENFRNSGMNMGFAHIKSSPYTRSSYMAHEYLEVGV